MKNTRFYSDHYGYKRFIKRIIGFILGVWNQIHADVNSAMNSST